VFCALPTTTCGKTHLRSWAPSEHRPQAGPLCHRQRAPLQGRAPVLGAPRQPSRVPCSPQGAREGEASPLLVAPSARHACTDPRARFQGGSNQIKISQLPKGPSPVFERAKAGRDLSESGKRKCLAVIKIRLPRASRGQGKDLRCRRYPRTKVLGWRRAVPQGARVRPNPGRLWRLGRPQRIP
jgi:hypothetical protein